MVTLPKGSQEVQTIAPSQTPWEIAYGSLWALGGRIILDQDVDLYDIDEDDNATPEADFKHKCGSIAGAHFWIVYTVRMKKVKNSTARVAFN